MCSWHNIQSDDADWTRTSGSTLTDLTGPSYDYSTYSTAGYYVYVETNGLKKGSKAVLESQQYNHFGHTCRLSFAYYMYGQDVGSLDVDVVTNSNTRTNLWSQSGDKGNQWKTSTLHLGTVNEGFKIQFIVTHAGGKLGDVALDMIELVNCHEGRSFSAVCLSVCLSVCPSVCLSVCLSVRLSVCLSVRLSVCLCV